MSGEPDRDVCLACGQDVPVSRPGRCPGCGASLVAAGSVVTFRQFSRKGDGKGLATVSALLLALGVAGLAGGIAAIYYIVPPLSLVYRLFGGEFRNIAEDGTDAMLLRFVVWFVLGFVVSFLYFIRRFRKASF